MLNNFFPTVPFFSVYIIIVSIFLPVTKFRPVAAEASAKNLGENTVDATTTIWAVVVVVLADARPVTPCEVARKRENPFVFP